MKRGWTIGAALAVCVMAAPAASQSAPAAAAIKTDWRALARGDVLAAYDIYVANHPGMHDPANPGFPDQLKRARDAALVFADKAGDEAGFRETLGAFSAGLQDGHAKLVAKQPNSSSAPLQFSWPGFVTAWRGDSLKVYHAAAGSPVAVGSTILGCDGMGIRELVELKLLTITFRSAEAGQWWASAPHVFAPSAELADRRPVRCTFRSPQGAERELALDWSPAPDNFGALLNAATDGERTSIGLTEPRTGMFLIGLPDFGPGEEGIKAYRALFETLKARGDDLGGARAVVIDLRHNNGGSSSWSRNTAKSLWGDATAEAAMESYFKDVAIWWRASEGNTAYVTGLEPMLREMGNTEIADMIKPVALGMQAALASGEPFFSEDEAKVAEVKPVPPSDFKTPVYVITPGRCGSACLDAVDTFTRFDNVKLIGAPTSADTTYMEIRSADLPSGKAMIVIPNKLWAGRPRQSGEIYTPDLLVTDLDWSTDTFLDRIEADLAAR